MRHGILAVAFGVAAALLAAQPSGAEEAVFDLKIRGLTAGTLRFDGSIEAESYRVTGRLESGGLIGMLRKVSYDGLAVGSVNGKRFTPQRYTEKADTGKRRSTSVMDYRRGVPQVKVYDPPRAPGDGGVDPATQGGTVDPLTAMFAAFRDVPEDAACNLTLRMFDGKRGSQVVLGAPVAADGLVECPGEYRRLEGFSAEEMAEKSRFPFTLVLEPAGPGLLRVSAVTMDSLYGKATLKRR